MLLTLSEDAEGCYPFLHGAEVLHFPVFVILR